MTELTDRADKALERLKAIPLEKPIGWSEFSVFVAAFVELRDRLVELEAEAEGLRAEVGLLRGEYGVRPMTDVESNLMTQVLDLRRQKSDLEAAVQRVREVAPQLELRKNEAAISASTDRFSAGAEHAYRASWLSLHSILAALDGSQQ